MSNYIIQNSLFSMVSGCTIVIFNKQISSELNLENSLLASTIGVGLIVFSTYLFWVYKRKKTNHIRWISILDFLWVIGTGIVCFYPDLGISNIGKAFLSGIALIVLYFGINQWKTVND